MKKSHLYIFIFLIFFLASTLASHAAGLKDAFGSDSLLNTTASKASYNTSTSITGSASSVILLILRIVGVVFIFLLVYGGIEWMTAGGNETRKGKSQEIIRAAIIGLIIVFGAYAISYFVIKAAGTGLISK